MRDETGPDLVLASDPPGPRGISPKKQLWRNEPTTSLGALPKAGELSSLWFKQGKLGGLNSLTIS